MSRRSLNPSGTVDFPARMKRPSSESAASSTQQFPLVAKVQRPADVRALADDQLQPLADDVRAFLIESIMKVGGHLGAGLGVVELTVALFAELDFERGDKLVWDVGHQCYPHKILTGRAARFDSMRRYRGLSGFPDPKESPYDTVKTGHGGTSISTAAGYALAWRHAGEAGRRTAVAVIGDGSMQEGNAYEALNHAGTYQNLDLVVVLNDNDMAISPSVGALKASLQQRRSGTTGNPSRGLFEELGFEYIGPIDGHDIAATRAAFREAQARHRPVLLHVLTRKGKGYRDDVPERTCYHAHPSPPDPAPMEYPEQGGPSFTAAFADAAIAMAERDDRVILITAAMLEGTGLVKFQERFPDRCIDVGMAEQHAVALAAGLALAGRRPICAIYSTFLQRAYDQVFQEVALQNAKVLFVMDRAGVVGADGPTHNGMFDIGYLRCLPNFALMAPRDTGELAQMMEVADQWDGPSAIRIPRGAGRRPESQVTHKSFGIGEAERISDGDDGAILAYGPAVYTALEVRRRVQQQSGRTLAVINARFAKPLDERAIHEALGRQPIVFTIEDNTLACGFGSAVAELALTKLRDQVDASRLYPVGLPDRFVEHAERGQQLADVGLDVEGVTRLVLAKLAGHRSHATPRSLRQHSAA